MFSFVQRLQEAEVRNQELTESVSHGMYRNDDTLQSLILKKTRLPYLMTNFTKFPLQKIEKLSFKLESNSFEWSFFPRKPPYIV